jgi:acetyl-CoA carboxylase biotin carboxyl carrier protein
LAQIVSTVSGTIIEVLVVRGAWVAVDEEVVLIESMKMEIPVAAEAQGRVREILIGPGDLVVEGQLLIDLD